MVDAVNRYYKLPVLFEPEMGRIILEIGLDLTSGRIVRGVYDIRTRILDQSFGTYRQGTGNPGKKTGARLA